MVHTFYYLSLYDEVILRIIIIVIKKNTLLYCVMLIKIRISIFSYVVDSRNETGNADVNGSRCTRNVSYTQSKGLRTVQRHDNTPRPRGRHLNTFLNDRHHTYPYTTLISTVIHSMINIQNISTNITYGSDIISRYTILCESRIGYNNCCCRSAAFCV